MTDTEADLLPLRLCRAFAGMNRFLEVCFLVATHWNFLVSGFPQSLTGLKMGVGSGRMAVGEAD